MVHHAESGPWYLLPRPFSCAKICCRLDRRQAVRHWVLVPAFAGSNPAGPAIFCVTKNGRQDESPRFVQCPVACDDGALFISCRSSHNETRNSRREIFLSIKKGATRAPGVGVNRRYDISPNRDCKMRDRCEV